MRDDCLKCNGTRNSLCIEKETDATDNDVAAVAVSSGYDDHDYDISSDQDYEEEKLVCQCVQ